ncbi:MAG: thioredoxin [Planctomycetaceae bacterium]|nr:thioredoxin [Planctomycetaceae bacterium]
MSENVAEFTDSNFQNDVLEADGPVLVDFWAPWCGPCKHLMPTIEELADDFAGKARIGKLNTDESPQTAQAHQISAIPTVLLFKDGQVVDKVVGVPQKAKLEEMINSQL